MATIADTLMQPASSERPHQWRRLAYLLVTLLLASVLVTLPRLLFAAGFDFLTVWLTHEDGPYEAWGALCCLAAALILFSCGSKKHQILGSGGVHRNWPMLLLAGGLLLMFLEEISWGQRIFSLATPDWLRRVNIQEEWTLHNLRFFHPSLNDNRLKQIWLYASVVYLGVMPLLGAAIPTLRRALISWDIPLASWQLALAALLAYFLYGQILAQTIAQRDFFAAHDVGEAIELVIEADYLVLAIEIFCRQSGRNPSASRRRLGLALGLIVGPLFCLMTWGFMAAFVVHDTNLAAVANLRRGNQYFASQQFPEAIASYEESLRLWPQQAAAHLRLAYLLTQSHETNRAAAHYREALALEPENVEALLGAGVALHAEGKLNEATALFQKAIELDPRNAAAYNNLGVLYGAKRQWRNAHDCFQKAVAINPDDAKAQHNLKAAAQALAREN